MLRAEDSRHIGFSPDNGDVSGGVQRNMYGETGSWSGCDVPLVVCRLGDDAHTEEDALCP